MNNSASDCARVAQHPGEGRKDRAVNEHTIDTIKSFQSEVSRRVVQQFNATTTLILDCRRTPAPAAPNVRRGGLVVSCLMTLRYGTGNHSRWSGYCLHTGLTHGQYRGFSCAVWKAWVCSLIRFSPSWSAGAHA